MDRGLSLPTHHSLTSDDVGYLVEVVDDVFSGPNL
jgi:dTDP-4-amino-4,6-dideoxygalactose transaminase